MTEVISAVDAVDVRFRIGARVAEAVQPLDPAALTNPETGGPGVRVRFIAADGWLITNGHVVAPAHQPRASLRDDQADKAVRAACGRLLPAAAARARSKVATPLDTAAML